MKNNKLIKHFIPGKLYRSNQQIYLLQSKQPGWASFEKNTPFLFLRFERPEKNHITEVSLIRLYFLIGKDIYETRYISLNDDMEIKFYTKLLKQIK